MEALILPAGWWEWGAGVGACAGGHPSFDLIKLPLKHLASCLLHHGLDLHLSDLCPSVLANAFCPSEPPKHEAGVQVYLLPAIVFWLKQG